MLPTFNSPVKRVLNFGDGTEKDRTRPLMDKVSDSTRPGKSSPIIPVVEDQEISTFHVVEDYANGLDSFDEANKTRSKTENVNGHVMGVRSEEMILNQPSQEAMQDLTEDNSEKEKCSPIAIMREPLCEEPALELILPGMSSQACQTDPELEEIVPDPLSNPTMVDKGVGTSGFGPAKSTSMPRPPLSTAGRTPSSVPVASNFNRTSVSATPPSTFAGAATKPPPVMIGKNVPNISAKSVNALPKAVAPSSLVTSKSSVVMNGLPPGAVRGVSTSKNQGSVPTGFSAPKSMAAAVNKPSAAVAVNVASTAVKPTTASVVKRNVRPNSYG